MKNCKTDTPITYSALVRTNMARRFSRLQKTTISPWTNIARKSRIATKDYLARVMLDSHISIEHRIRISIWWLYNTFGWDFYCIFRKTFFYSNIFCIQNNLQSKNNIYKTNYSGWYCVPDEMFLTDSQLKDKEGSPGVKVSIESGHPVEWTEEENYMFKLSKYQDDVIYWVKQW